jgi:hypothetical protein
LKVTHVMPSLFSTRIVSYVLAAMFYSSRD